MWNETLGKIHFWVTFLGAYRSSSPCTISGFLGVPRRYYELGDDAFIPPSVRP